MRVYRNGAFFTVTCNETDVYEFKRQFPCSGLPDCGIAFEFDANGDLVDIRCRQAYEDGAGISALAEDAKIYGMTRLVTRPWKDSV